MALYELGGGGSSGVGLPVSITDVTDLANQLAGKAVSNHTHVISDVTDLQTEIDRLDTRIDGSSGGTALPIAISDVTNLQTSLDAKALTTHIHAMTDVTGLIDGLALKVDKTFDINYTKNIKVVNINSDGTQDYTTLSAAVTALFDRNISLETDSLANKEIYTRYRIILNSNTTEPSTEINIDMMGVEIELVGASIKRTINTTNSIFFRNCKVYVSNILINNTGPKITSETTVYTSYVIRSVSVNVALGFFGCPTVAVININVNGGDHGLLATNGTNVYLTGTNSFLYTARPIVAELSASIVNKGSLTCAQENGTSVRSFTYTSGCISILSASSFYSNGTVNLIDCYIGIRLDGTSTGIATGVFNITNFSGAGVRLDVDSAALFENFVINGITGGTSKIGVTISGNSTLYPFKFSIQNTYLPWHSNSGSHIEIYGNITDTGTTGSYSAIVSTTLNANIVRFSSDPGFSKTTLGVTVM